MPNSDTMGNMIREKLVKAFSNTENVKLIESFGMKGYLSCMKHCSFMLGNTSSGFVEAAFFPKWVINIGDRQKGRIITPNIINTAIEKDKILQSIRYLPNANEIGDCNIYGDGNAANIIISKIKTIYELK
jgi:GDP/UDP-N,N'-diacetylbacillosamine 2-epimerase (hydrolysing)